MTNAPRNLIILALTPLVLLPPLSMDIYVPSVPSMKEHLQTSAELIQWTLSIFMIGMSIGQIVMGPLVDRYGRRKIGLLSLSLYLLATIACSGAQTVCQLIVARLFQALGACGCSVMVWTVIRDIVPQTQQGKIYSYLNGLSGLGPLIAPLLGGYLVLWLHSWRAPFIFLCFYAILVLSLLFFVLPETLKPDRVLPLEWKQIFKRFGLLLGNFQFIRYAFCAGVGMSCLFAYFSISPILIIEQLGIPAHYYGFYFAANGLTYVAGCMIASQLQARLGFQPIVQIGCFLMFLGGIIMLGVNEMTGLTLMGIVIPNFILACGVGFIFGPAMAGALQHFGHMAGTAAACLGSLQFILAAFVGAAVSAATCHNAEPYAATMSVLSLIALMLVRSRTRKR